MELFQINASDCEIKKVLHSQINYRRLRRMEQSHSQTNFSQTYVRTNGLPAVFELLSRGVAARSPFIKPLKREKPGKKGFHFPLHPHSDSSLVLIWWLPGAPRLWRLLLKQIQPRRCLGNWVTFSTYTSTVIKRQLPDTVSTYPTLRYRSIDLLFLRRRRTPNSWQSSRENMLLLCIYFPSHPTQISPEERKDTFQSKSFSLSLRLHLLSSAWAFKALFCLFAFSCRILLNTHRSIRIERKRGKKGRNIAQIPFPGTIKSLLGSNICLSRGGKLSTVSTREDERGNTTRKKERNKAGEFVDNIKSRFVISICARRASSNFKHLRLAKFGGLRRD